MDTYSHYDSNVLDGDESCFDELSQTLQDDLIEWLNLTEPDEEDKKRLFDLAKERRFSSWDCPACGHRIYVADPEDWDHFQGANQSECLGELCAWCAQTYLHLKAFAEE